MSRSSYDRPIRRADATARAEVDRSGWAPDIRRKTGRTHLGLSRRAARCHEEWMEKLPCRVFRRPFLLKCKYCQRWFWISKEQAEAFDEWVATNARPKRGEL